MKTPAVFIRKASVLAALAGSLFFGGGSPKTSTSAEVLITCAANGNPCSPLDCSYWQCQIDNAYTYGYENRCKAVMDTYRGIAGGCPTIVQCNLYLYGCN
jgi:hypothetical protein